MTNEFDDLPESSGIGGPSFGFKEVGDTVTGTVLLSEGIAWEPIDKDKVKPLPDGTYGRQLHIVLGTDLRDYAGVNRAPKDREGKVRPKSDDEGNRSLYALAPGKTSELTPKGSKALFTAIRAAVKEATGKAGVPEAGGKLSVKFSEARDTGQIQPAKLYEAKYQAPAPKAEDPWATDADGVEPPF